MRLDWVELRDFRNHALTRIEPVPSGVCVAVGPNGEGKTNLLEGMHVLYALQSPRTSTHEAMVREGAGSAFVRGEFQTHEGKVLVEVEIRRQGANRVQVNRSPVRRRRDLRRQVRAVLFGPFDLPIVTGDPAKRRAFLDEVVVSLQPALDTLASGYEKVLRQRNRLLREWDGRGAPAGLEAWDEQLVQAGAALATARASAAERLAAPADDAFRATAGYGLIVRYRPSVPFDDDPEGSLRAELARRRPDELIRRTSLVGPHRDDLELAVRDLGARSAGSHGETWATALCLRLAQATEVERAIGEPPLLLVDDPYSALDPARRDRLAERLAQRGGQVVLTVADEADVPAGAAAVWDVRAGTVTPRGGN
jgi:DNA replication and repair protein RecF